MTIKELFLSRLAFHRSEAKKHTDAIDRLRHELLMYLRDAPQQMTGTQLQIRATEMLKLEAKLEAQLALIQELEILEMVGDG